MTNRSAVSPYWTAVMSHGPSMPYPVMVFLTLPHWSRTIRQPGPEMLLLTVGSEPTITQPLGSATRAVVRPTPPGHAGSLTLANRLALPRGETWTMVVPVPWALAVSLKLLTSTSPRYRWPVLRGTTATPYGLTSPLAGTVEATTLVWCNSPMNVVGDALALAANAPLASKPPAPIRAAAMTAAERLMVFLGNLLRCTGIRAPSA